MLLCRRPQKRPDLEDVPDDEGPGDCVVMMCYGECVRDG